MTQLLSRNIFMRNLLLVIIGMLLGGSLHAAEKETAPDFDWVIQAGGKLHDKTRGIAVDGKGNIYLTGEFTGTATFGEFTLTSNNMMDFFIAKVDSRGKFLWVRSGGGSKIDRGYAITVDDAGNSYVTGHYESTDAKFGDVSLPNSGDYDIFVAKYDSSGKMLWIKTAGGKGYDYGHGIAVDSLGNLFVTGALAGEGTFDEVKLSEPGSSRVFCARYTTEGKILWVKTTQGKGNSSGHGIAVDGKGNCFLGGHTGGDGFFGDFKLTNSMGRDILVAKLDASGKVHWVAQGHGSSGAMIHEITADTNGNVWASGMFKGELKLKDRVVKSKGDSDILLMSFGSDGSELWTKTAGGPGIDYGLGVATDNHGNSFLTGSFTATVLFEGEEKISSASADIFIISFNRSGKVRWFNQVSGKGTDHAYSIALDSSGNIYLSGACSGNAMFGKHPFTNLGSNDIFLAKLKPK
ncbi:MAG: hypothetical protein EBT92_11965 [Planctomycetes bacterium]|nr:hypothetical protein [Planctomycetota bacterium]